MIMRQFRLEGKRAIVTGGSRGLCYGMAQGLYEAGAQVVLIASSDRVYQAAREIGTADRPVYAVKGNLSETERIPAIYQEAKEQLGGAAEILINGAGIQYRAPAEEFPLEQWDNILRVNLTALFCMAQCAGKDMLKRRYGKIINIASMCSFFGSVLIPAYSASKGGVAQLTKALANEWAGRGVNVNAIAPGYMLTELSASIKEKNPSQYQEITSRIPAGRWGTAEDLKGLAVFLASEASSYINGAVIPVDGGYLGK